MLPSELLKGKLKCQDSVCASRIEEIVQKMDTEPENHPQPSARSPVSPRASKSDPKQSLQHILTTSEPFVKTKHRPEDQLTPSDPVKPETPSKQPIIWIDG